MDVLAWILLPCFVGVVYSSHDAARLYTHLMQPYNKLIRPVASNTDQVTVRLSMKLTQLIGVDEVNQVITTSVTVRQTWNDYKLRWNPADFGNISTMDVPSDAIWLPDLVLYNNADGIFHLSPTTKAMVNSSGDVIWEPPAIYKSACSIDVTYFPYDKQDCFMKLSCWTYDMSMVDLVPWKGFRNDNQKILVGMDLSDYKKSIEWDILEASAIRDFDVYYYGTWAYIKFNLVIRRKTLFYTVNLIIPCVLISCLTVFVFYLPSDSGEKVTLCISILVSLTVFVLLLAKIIPQTSITVPLIGQYLLFTMVLVTLSIAATIVVINIHFRNPSTHIMRPWFRRVFIEVLPKILLLERPKDYARENALMFSSSKFLNDLDKSSLPGQLANGFASPRTPGVIHLSEDVQEAVNGINFIADHIWEAGKINQTVKDWKYVAMVMDRLFLWIFGIAVIVGTGKIILDAPSLYEYSKTVPRQCLNETEPYDPWECLYMDEDPV